MMGVAKLQPIGNGVWEKMRIKKIQPKGNGVEKDIEIKRLLPNSNQYATEFVRNVDIRMNGMKIRSQNEIVWVNRNGG